MSEPTKPPPRPPGPWDHEDPPDGARPKAPKRPKPPPQDGDSKEVTLGWADEPAAPGDYAEIIRRAPSRAPGDLVTVEAQADWKGILSTTRDGAPIPEGHDDAAPCPACIATPCGCEEE